MNSDDWDARYREAALARDTVWSLEPNEWVVEVLAGLPPGDAVDLAAGEGRNALWLASLGWRVTAVDFAGVGLAAGAARAQQLGLDVGWQKADATTWVSAEPVDLVLIAYLQLPKAELAKVIGTAASALAPGGILALIAHDRANTVGGPKDAEVLTTVAELTEAVNAAGPSTSSGNENLRSFAEPVEAGPSTSSGIERERGNESGAGHLEIVECRQRERVTSNGTALDTVLIARAPF